MCTIDTQNALSMRIMRFHIRVLWVKMSRKFNTLSDYRGLYTHKRVPNRLFRHLLVYVRSTRLRETVLYINSFWLFMGCGWVVSRKWENLLLNWNFSYWLFKTRYLQKRNGVVVRCFDNFTFHDLGGLAVSIVGIRWRSPRFDYRQD